MKIEIRPAQESEIVMLRLFEKGIVEAERPLDNTLKEGDIEYYDLMELIRSEHAEVLVAVVDNTLVGPGYAKIMPAKSYKKI